MPERLTAQDAIDTPVVETELPIPDQPYKAELPVASDQEHLRTRTRLGYAMYDLSGEVQEGRGKENIIYTNVTTGERFFAKYISQQEGTYFNDVEGMAQEKLLLDYLAPTGVVPKTGVFRIYPNQQRARLLLELLEGQSLDDMEFDDEVMSFEQATEIIVSTAQSLQKVHDAGVVVGDVNFGTFLVDTSGEVPTARILDLEIGCHVDDAPERLTNLANWCARNDMGAELALAERGGEVDDELMYKIEMHRWGQVMAQWLLSDTEDWPDIKLGEPYAAQLAEVDAYLGPTIKRNLEQAYRNLYRKEYEPRKKLGYEIEDEDEFVAIELVKDYPKYLKLAAPGVYFLALLDNFEFEIPANLREFIAKTLSPRLEDRPVSFAPILANQAA